jgi:hypothetical protein
MHAMKFDKDALKKHKFWFLLLVQVPLTLIVMLVLWTVVSGVIAAERKKIDAASKIGPPATLANDETNGKLQEEADKLKKKEVTAWEANYKTQEPLFTWPDRVEDTYKFSSGKFAVSMNVLEAPAAAPAGENKDGPADTPNLYHGTVADLFKDWVLVKGNDGKTEKFYRTPEFRIDLKERKGYFNEIPRGQAVSVTYYSTRYFYDKLTDTEQRAAYAPAYLKQVSPIIDSVEPLLPTGEGVVQFKGWMPAAKGDIPLAKTSFLWFKPDDWKLDFDISEEAWLAQEDLWIQREVFRMVRLANDYVGKCDGKGGDGLNKNYQFKNAYFELDLKLLASDKLEVTIKNRQNRRQRLDVSFKIKFHKSFDAEKVLVGGEPLEPNDPLTKNPNVARTIVIDLPKIPRTGIYSVEQVLTWDTAAVKRMDNIVFGVPDSLGHRHAGTPLKPYREPPVDPSAPPKDAPGAPPGTPPGMPPGGPPDRGPGGIPGAGGDGAGGLAGVALTPNGFNPKRYVEVNDQYRRLPIAVSMIVDQDHLDRVQAAFNNSKYRFLTTQVLLNHYPGSMRPILQAGGINPMGGEGPAPMPMPGGPRPFPMPPGMGPGVPMQPGQPNDPNAGGSDELESNFEIVIYGFMTIYERYPKKGVETPGAAPGGAPGNPPPPPPPMPMAMPK